MPGEVGERIEAQREEAEVMPGRRPRSAQWIGVAGGSGKKVEHAIWQSLGSAGRLGTWRRGRRKGPFPPRALHALRQCSMSSGDERDLHSQPARGDRPPQACRGHRRGGRRARHAHKARPKVVELLRNALHEGRRRSSPAGSPSTLRPGTRCANGYAFLIDQLIRVMHDHVIARRLSRRQPHAGRAARDASRSAATGAARWRRIRTSTSPSSRPASSTAWCEQVIEAMLYLLWDLGLKVGHSSRIARRDGAHGQERPDDPHRAARRRAICGATRRSTRRRAGASGPRSSHGTERQFVTEKLAERNARHKRMGDSRYVVEPNVKDGKGGLRDLQTLYWIGKYIHRVQSAAELVDVGPVHPAANTAASAAPRASCWRCAATCTRSPAAPRTG